MLDELLYFYNVFITRGNKAITVISPSVWNIMSSLGGVALNPIACQSGAYRNRRVGSDKIRTSGKYKAGEVTSKGNPCIKLSRRENWMLFIPETDDVVLKLAQRRPTLGKL